MPMRARLPDSSEGRIPIIIGLNEVDILALMKEGTVSLPLDELGIGLVDIIFIARLSDKELLETVAPLLEDDCVMADLRNEEQKERGGRLKPNERVKLEIPTSQILSMTQFASLVGTGAVETIHDPGCPNGSNTKKPNSRKPKKRR